MKYIAIFDDSMLSNFRLDDEGLTLVLTDKTYCTRAVRLKPIIRPILTVTEDCGGSSTDSVYLTEGHIDAMKAYEEKSRVDEVIKALEVPYREESCNYKYTCNDYHYWHCIGCNGSKYKEADDD